MQNHSQAIIMQLIALISIKKINKYAIIRHMFQHYYQTLQALNCNQFHEILYWNKIKLIKSLIILYKYNNEVLDIDINIILSTLIKHQKEIEQCTEHIREKGQVKWRLSIICSVMCEDRKYGNWLDTTELPDYDIDKNISYWKSKIDYDIKMKQYLAIIGNNKNITMAQMTELLSEEEKKIAGKYVFDHGPKNSAIRRMSQLMERTNDMKTVEIRILIDISKYVLLSIVASKDVIVEVLSDIKKHLRWVTTSNYTIEEANTELIKVFRMNREDMRQI